MILLIVGMSLLGLGLLLCCSVMVYKCVIEHGAENTQIGRIINGNKVSNEGSEVAQIEIMAPALPYHTFIKEVGIPLHDHCVICL